MFSRIPVCQLTHEDGGGEFLSVFILLHSLHSTKCTMVCNLTFKGQSFPNTCRLLVSQTIHSISDGKS